MKTCCDLFENLLGNAGRDDLAVLAKTTGEYRMFVFQSRACRIEDEHILQELPREIDMPKPLHVVTQVAIQYCPFCGFSLQQLIKADENGFVCLCVEHSQLVI